MAYSAELTRTFLESYKRLEMLEDANPRTASLLRKKHEEDRDLMRQVRNVLAHNTDSSLSYPVAVSDALLSTLKALLAEMDATALSCAIPASVLYVAHPRQPFTEVVQVMAARGYSHVPIVNEKNVVLGVLTDSLIIRLLAIDGKLVTSDIETMSELSSYTSLSSHRKGKILFRRADTPRLEIEEMFRSSYEEKERITALFLTKKGTEKEPLLGMITRADALLKNA